MDCPLCLGQTAVIDSRHGGDHHKRRRKCLSCGIRFNTIEVDMDSYCKIERHVQQIKKLMEEVVSID